MRPPSLAEGLSIFPLQCRLQRQKGNPNPTALYRTVNPNPTALQVVNALDATRRGKEYDLSAVRSLCIEGGHGFDHHHPPGMCQLIHPGEHGANPNPSSTVAHC